MTRTGSFLVSLSEQAFTESRAGYRYLQRVREVSIDVLRPIDSVGSNYT